MAVELKNNTEEDDDQQAAPSLGGPAASTSSAGTPAAASTARPAMPGNRPNIQQYLQANQGAGEKLASGITGGFQKQVNKFGEEVGKTRGALESGSRPLEQKLGDEGSQFAQSSFKDPQSLLNQQSQLDEFRRLQGQGYKGDISSLQQNVANQQTALQGRLAGLDESAKGSATETGRFQLLRNTFGQPNYTQGQQRLDQLFLQAQPGVNRQLQQNLQGMSGQASQQAKAFGTEATSRLDALNKLSADRAAQISGLLKTGTDTAGLETDISGRGLEDINQSAQARLTAAQQAADAVPGLQERLKNNQLTAQDLTTLGLQPGTQIYDTDLMSFMTRGEHLPTIATAADPAEFARYRALQQLAGDTSGDIYGGATEAGGFNPYQFDRDAMLQQASNRRDFWETTRPRELADSVANIFRPLENAGFTGINGGFRAAGPSPVAQYGANVLAPALAQATTVDQMQQILNAYDQMYRGYVPGGIEAMNPSSPLYEPLMNLQRHLQQATQYRQRNLQPASTEPQANFSNTFGVS